MKFIVGRKKEMSQVFLDDGRVVPVTIVEAGPCVVTQVRTNDKDGYTAVQVGFGNKKSLNKPLSGHLKGLMNAAVMKEFRVAADEAALERGQEITTKVFAEGDVVKVTGISKGKGFAGVVKRHGFHGQGTSHGVKDQVRMPGSSGAGGVQRVFKGVKKPGRMGGDQITVANLEVVKKDDENNLLYIKGAVPGSRNAIITIFGSGVMDFSVQAPVAEPVAEESTVETPVEQAAEAQAPVAEAPAAAPEAQA